MLRRHNLRVGLTGGFGTGKSTVAKLFGRLGAHRIDADRLVHEEFRKRGATYRKVLRAFGPEILKRGGRIDRARLAACVFRHPRRLKRLERIVHPVVFRRIEDRLRRLRRGIAIIEVPLLFETRYDRRVDRIITVTAARRVVIKRMMRLRRLKGREIRERIKAQIPLSVKRKKSDFVVNNNFGFGRTAEQVRCVWAQLKNEVS